MYRQPPQTLDAALRPGDGDPGNGDRPPVHAQRTDRPLAGCPRLTACTDPRPARTMLMIDAVPTGGRMQQRRLEGPYGPDVCRGMDRELGQAGQEPGDDHGDALRGGGEHSLAASR